jgi:hypothetical protein
VHSIAIAFVQCSTIVADIVILDRRLGGGRIVAEMWWRCTNAIVTVDFVSDDVMCLQQSLGEK